MIPTYRKSTFRLLVTMIMVSLLVTGIAIFVIFKITLKEKKNYLQKLSDHQYGIIQSLYQRNRDKEKVLEFLKEQQISHPGLEETGEFTISYKQGDTVFLILHKQYKGSLSPIKLNVKSSFGKPSIFAASGNTGFYKGDDYRGNYVIAHCEYNAELGWGIVTKIDYSEILKPFSKASLYAFLATVVLVLVGTFFFKRFSDPLYTRIAESEEKYHTLFDFIPSGITISNKNGDILESNLESEKLLGVPKEEHYNRQIDSKDWQIIRLDGTPMPADEFASTIALKENRVVANVEMGIIKQKNQITWLNVSAAPFPLKDLGIMVVYSDITRRVEAENTLRLHDKKLQEYADELKSLNETKDKFFNIMAHDLKNPFSSLLGASEYLYKNSESHNAEKVKKLSKILYGAAKSGYDILANLLEWSRSQTGNLNFEPATLNLADIIANNVSLISAMADSKKINVEVDVDHKLEAKADSNMLNTVLRNLLTNALKFTGKGGEIRVSAKKVDSEIIVTVKDSGIGIPKKDIDKLFRIDVKYVNQGTENEKGTGLGLILCKEFINQHGGKIWVDSKPNSGSEFHFSIPV